MSQPFYQPARQNLSSSQSMQQPQGGFGGFGGGYQMPQQSFGGGFGDGYGSGFGFGGGFQPSFGGGFGGGYGSGFSGGFQPQGFGSFGGFGGGFNPYQGGFGGGYNPMFGGIGGLGFNPMMGPQFGMPMQGFNPYQQQFQPQFNQRQNVDSQGRVFVPDAPLPEGMVGTMGGTGYDPVTGRVDLGRAGGSGTYVQPQSPFTGPQRSAQDILSMAVGKTPQDMQYDLNKDGKITSADALAYQRQYGQQPAAPAPPQTTPRENDYVDPSGKLVSSQTGKRYRTASDMIKGDRIDAGETRTTSPLSSAMLSGLGSLGFNPMMGPQFGMPMQRPFNPADDSGMGAENARSARENMRNMSPAQMQNLQSLMQQLQSYGINSPQGQAMLG